MAPAGYEDWLDPGERSPESLNELLGPFPALEMMAYPISRKVNSPANDSPDVIEPVEA